MPSFSKFTASIKRKWNEVSSAPAPTVETQDSALPRIQAPTSVTADIPPATLTAALLILPTIPSVEQPPIDETPPPRPPIATVSVDALSGGNNDLWARAYALAKEHEQELMEDYEKHITSLGGVSVATKSFSDPHDVQAHVNQLLELRQKKKIQVSILGRDITMREQVEKLAKFLIWSDSIVKSAVSAQPYAALAWSGVSMFLPLLISGAKYDDGMLKGFSSISDMQIFWKSCEETYFRSDMKVYQNLNDPLIRLYSSIIEYQARVICHLSKAQLSRAWQSITGSDDWTDAMESLKELEDKCLRLVDKVYKDVIQEKMDSQLQEIQRSRIVQEEILQAIKEEREDEKERKLLSDLATTSGDYERYKNINPERVPKTCLWFLTDERFHNWRDSKSGDLLWVSAGPGCGKSVLSKSLIDERHLSPETTVTISSSTISVSESVICYFFFKDGGEGKMDNAQALCAILHQLFIHIPQLRTHALSSHKTYGQDLMQRTDELWRILVDCAKSSPLPIICLLDALDECKENEGIGLINKLCDLYRHANSATPSKLKFLITSRPYETLKMSFDRLTATSAYLHFDGDNKSGQISQEINLVIDVKVNHITGGFSAKDRNKVSQRLKNMENRTYLWLYLTIEIIERNIAAYSRRTDMEEFLSKLPSTVSEAYEKILSRSQDERKVEALLQIVLAAQRPLTLVEANYALTLILGDEFSSHEELQENLWPQDRFKTTPGNLCGLFISIHDSKLSFIHQTAREFLLDPEPSGTWKGRLSLSKSHGILSEACMNYLLMADTPIEARYDELRTTHPGFDQKYPLFSYASNSWISHFHSYLHSQEAGSTDKHRKLARALCRVSAPQTRNWINGLKSFSFVDSYWNKWPDFLLAVYFNLAAVVSDMMAHEQPDVNLGWDYEKPLSTAIDCCNFEVMEVLLEPDSGVEITSYNVYMALRDSSSAKLALLLDKRGDEIKITEGRLKTAVENYYGGVAVMALLLNKRPNEVKITENVLKSAASWGSAETMSLLLNERGSDIKITEDVVLATIDNRDQAMLLSLLLERRAHEIKITESLMIAATEKASVDWVNVLLDKRGNRMKITEDIVKAASTNTTDDGEMGLQMVALLLDKYGDEFKITQDIVKAAVSNFNPKLIALLLDKRGHEFIITEDIVRTAINSPIVLEKITLLLDKRGHEFTITQDIVLAAAHSDSASKTIPLLLDKRGYEFKITEDIVKAAAMDILYPSDLMTLFLDKRGHEFKITEDIVEAAARSPTPRASNLITLLLDKRGHEFKITEEIVKAASDNRCLRGEVVTLLQDRRRREMDATENGARIA